MYQKRLNGFKEYVKYLLKVIYLHSVPPPGFCWWFESPTKFSKKGDLTGSQFLEGGCWKRGGEFFQQR